MKKWHTTFACSVLAIILVLGLICGLSSQTVAPSTLTPAHPIESVLFNAQSATVRIAIQYEGEWKHIGSGFVASTDGYIITARHVADLPTSYRVVWMDGSRLDAEVVYTSTFTDCAVLKVKHRGFKAASFRVTRPYLGEQVYVIGSPIDELFGNYVTCGVVSKVSVSMPGLSLLDLFMVDAPINPGNSGGPVFDREGNVLGIAIARIGGADGMGFVVPSVDIVDILQKATHGKGRKKEAPEES